MLQFYCKFIFHTEFFLLATVFSEYKRDLSETYKK